MKSNLAIIPAVLATSEAEYQKKVQIINCSSVFQGGLVQIDVADGRFVQNTTVSGEIIKKYPLFSPAEVHLMVDDPQAWVTELSGLNVRRFIGHLELPDERLKQFINQCKKTQSEIGFALNPETPVNALTSYQQIAQSVLVMSVHPGLGGQQLLPTTIQKVEEVARLRQQNHLQFLIGVDGGINSTNARSLVGAGADYLVIGESLIYGDVTANLEQIWEETRF